MPRALFIGRFQPFHNAHLINVKNILKENSFIIIGIGSSQEKNTLENPFSYNERRQMIANVLKKEKIKNFMIYPVPDLYDDKKWMGYIEKSLPKADFFYSGNEWTLRCFRKHGYHAKNIRLVKGLSSTKIRGMMAEGKNWQSLVPKEAAEYINKIKGVERIRKCILAQAKRTPLKSLVYRMPAEWEMQSAVWISWPHNRETWQSLSMLGKVEESYVEFVKALHTGQKVKILVNDGETKKRIAAKLGKADVSLSQIIFYKIKTADVWIRDYGPTFVLGSSSKEELAEEMAIVKWKFNAWGGKYGELKQDDSVPYKISKVMGLPVFDAGIVLEGGSIDVNGSGTLLTTEQCLLNKSRNPRMGKPEIEERLKSCLNASNILWLKSGIAGDDTDGHVDDIARFINKNTVACAFEENKGDENYEALKENYALLNKMRDEDGNRLNIVKLPMPEPVFSDGKGSARLPASYANFYIGNEAVAVPVFGSKSDANAIKLLQSLFPDRKVVGINCRAMVHGLGALHCVSQQEPGN